MVNLRHPDNIFYDREGDLFIITTDLDGRQEVVCKTNVSFFTKEGTINIALQIKF